MKAPLPLTEKERSVLEFIELQISDSGIAPSYQEIKDHFGFASFNSVQNYIKQLTQKGYLLSSNNQKRSLQILQSPSAAQEWVLAQKSSSPPRSSKSLKKVEPEEAFYSVPLLGKVAAGQPIEAFEHDTFVDVPPSLVRNPSKSFALKVEGQSMIEDGIFDGDIILVQKQQSASNGEIIVASIENESTVKRFFLSNKPNSKDKSTDKWVELRPANSNMKSMWYSPDQVQIQGVVVGLVRKF